MSYIVCPYCNEEIDFKAKKCKHCGEGLDESGKPTMSISQTAIATSNFTLEMALVGKYKILEMLVMEGWP